MKKDEGQSSFEKAAKMQTGGSFLGDFWFFLRTNKKWWLTPIVVIFVLAGVLMLLSSTGLAPFIYTLF